MAIFVCQTHDVDEQMPFLGIDRHQQNFHLKCQQQHKFYPALISQNTKYQSQQCVIYCGCGVFPKGCVLVDIDHLARRHFHALVTLILADSDSPISYISSMLSSKFTSLVGTSTGIDCVHIVAVGRELTSPTTLHATPWVA